jgi:hypothetical protein
MEGGGLDPGGRGATPTAPTSTTQQTIDGSKTRSDLQTYLGTSGLNPHEMLAKLQEAKSNGKAAWWGKLKPVLLTAKNKPPSNLQAVLECVDCGDPLSGTNPSSTANSHFVKGTWLCKKSGNINKPVALVVNTGKKQAVLGGGSSSSAAGASTSPGSNPAAASSSRRLMPKYLVDHKQQQSVVRHLMRFLIKRSTLSAVEDPDLVRTFDILGCELPRKCFCIMQH